MRGLQDLPETLPGMDYVAPAPSPRESGVQTVVARTSEVANDVKNAVVNMHHMADDDGNPVGSWAV